jgi:predicted nucleic acid-binding Zn ribbon protein
MNRSEPSSRAARRTATPLGELVKDLMERRICPQQNKYESVARVLDGLLPTELRQHCRLEGISGGQVKVTADSPSYMQELRLCSSELLKELQQRCPKARIKNIRYVVGTVTR